MSYIVDLLAAVRTQRVETTDFYNQIADRYDSLHRGWMAIGGSMAVAAVEGCVAGALRPGSAVLDAGCGTGRVARELIPLVKSCRFTLLDAAPRMLDLTQDLSAERHVGDLRALPFDDASFDIVLSTWALETLATGRETAIREFDRVLKPGGTMVYSVCASPRTLRAGALSFAHRKVITTFFHGNFLTLAEAVPVELPGVRVLTFHGGLSTVVIYRKETSIG